MALFESPVSTEICRWLIRTNFFRSPSVRRHKYFVVDNIGATYDELKAKGVEFTQPPKKETWGEHAILKDSEGNLVLIGQG
jgi:predicted enzyme related to lactoylglutathione lyase